MNVEELAYLAGASVIFKEAGISVPELETEEVKQASNELIAFMPEYSAMVKAAEGEEEQEEEQDQDPSLLHDALSGAKGGGLVGGTLGAAGGGLLGALIPKQNIDSRLAAILKGALGGGAIGATEGGLLGSLLRGAQHYG